METKDTFQFIILEIITILILDSTLGIELAVGKGLGAWKNDTCHERVHVSLNGNRQCY